MRGEPLIAQSNIGNDMYLFLDSHPNHQITTPFSNIVGWGSLPCPCRVMDARIAGVSIPFARTLRPDLDSLGPELIFGYSAYIDIPTLSRDSRISPGPTDVVFLGDDAEVARLNIVIADDAFRHTEEICRNRILKREFINKTVRRPLHHPDGCAAPSALPADWALSPKLSDKMDRTSANEYGGAVTDFLRSTIKDGGFALDVGAGLRKTPSPNVINMDIYDYPSTDLLGVGEDLPFYDNVFDGVLSIAVLEHVEDPFTCAKELIRVTKPGGKIFCIIPFLQAEHGYPAHYFNATRFGMQRLFREGTSIEKHFLEFSNHPIFTVNQVLGTYAAGLPEPLKTAFLDTPVRQLVETLPTEMCLGGHEFVTQLAEETRWLLASGTTAIFVKDEAAR